MVKLAQPYILPIFLRFFLKFKGLAEAEDIILGKNGFNTIFSHHLVIFFSTYNHKSKQVENAPLCSILYLSC